MTKDFPATSIELVRLLEVFGPLYRRHVGRELPSGSPARLRALAVLAEKGPQTMRDLARAVGATAQNITGLVNALETEGLVARAPVPGDRRKTTVHLTPEAAGRVEADRDEHRRRVAALFEPLSEPERSALARSLRVLIGRLEG
jgi:DNA-binding MarR family transcriptional regulator